MNLVDGRKELLDEVVSADAAVREYIQQEFENLLADELFTEKFSWHLHPDSSNQARVPFLIERLRKLAGLYSQSPNTYLSQFEALSAQSRPLEQRIGCQPDANIIKEPHQAAQRLIH